MSISNEDYAIHVEELLASIAQAHALGNEIDLAFCTSGLEVRRDHKKVRDFAIKILKIKSADFDRAIKIEAVKAAFDGVYPSDAEQLVRISCQEVDNIRQI